MVTPQHSVHKSRLATLQVDCMSAKGARDAREASKSRRAMQVGNRL